MTTYQLQVQINGKGTPVNTTWSPRSIKSASALAHYCQRVWPNNIYWLLPIYN
jgi:hypothetical protein